MENSQILVQAFVDTLGIDSSEVKDDLSYDGIPEWDSLAHMRLVAELEDKFDIMLDTNEILDMSSVRVIKRILSKHGPQF
tara:strand:- start:150 stop:389 length:240 start_codon:yes stop_codon:yes gene_type:complete